MDCILRVIRGPDEGLSVKLASGQTLIGRSGRAGLKLSGEDVSWEHALITRSGDDYLLENLSSFGTYLEGTRLTNPVRLRPREQIRLSPQTVLRVEAVDGSGRPLGSRRMLWWVAGIAVVVLLGLLVAKAVISASTPRDDWDRAYGIIDPWVSSEIRRGRLPQTALEMFREAWRLEQVMDYKNSRFAWLKLQLLLDSLADKRDFAGLSRSDPQALQRLLTPQLGDSESDDDQLAAAWAQFIQRRLTWSASKVKRSSLGRE